MPLVKALRSGFEIGTATGGSSTIGLAIKGIADKLKASRETETAIGVLGRTERVKAEIKQEFEPKFQPIVGPKGEVVGQRPKGAVFEPKQDTFERQIIGGIRAMKADGDPLEEINDFINFSGANPADFAAEIGDYSPAPKKSFLKGLGDLFKR